MTEALRFVEHHVPHGQGNIYARDYAGADPAFVLMHGFPTICVSTTISFPISSTPAGAS